MDHEKPIKSQSEMNEFSEKGSAKIDAVHFVKGTTAEFVASGENFKVNGSAGDVQSVGVDRNGVRVPARDAMSIKSAQSGYYSGILMNDQSAWDKVYIQIRGSDGKMSAEHLMEKRP